MSVYKQAQLLTESLEVQNKEKKSDYSSRHKEQQVQFLQQQIKLRDGMINEWKNIITDGKMKNKIVYKNLKNVEDVAENAKLNNSSIQNTSPVNTSLQYSPKRRVQSQLSIHPKVIPQQLKIQMSYQGRKRSQLVIQGSDTNLVESYSSHSIKSSKGNRKSSNNSPASIQPNGNLLKAKQRNNLLKFSKPANQKYFN